MHTTFWNKFKCSSPSDATLMNSHNCLSSWNSMCGKDNSRCFTVRSRPLAFTFWSKSSGRHVITLPSNLHSESIAMLSPTRLLNCFRNFDNPKFSIRKEYNKTTTRVSDIILVYRMLMYPNEKSTWPYKESYSMTYSLKSLSLMLSLWSAFSFYFCKDHKTHKIKTFSFINQVGAGKIDVQVGAGSAVDPVITTVSGGRVDALTGAWYSFMDNDAGMQFEPGLGSESIRKMVPSQTYCMLEIQTRGMLIKHSRR